MPNKRWERQFLSCGTPCHKKIGLSEFLSSGHQKCTACRPAVDEVAIVIGQSQERLHTSRAKPNRWVQTTGLRWPCFSTKYFAYEGPWNFSDVCRRCRFGATVGSASPKPSNLPTWISLDFIDSLFHPVCIPRAGVLPAALARPADQHAGGSRLRFRRPKTFLALPEDEVRKSWRGLESIESIESSKMKNCT